MDKAIEKRLAVLERLLADESTVHPPGCNCAIKSRDITHHASDCPYRQLLELIPMLRAETTRNLEQLASYEAIERKRYAAIAKAEGRSDG